MTNEITKLDSEMNFFSKRMFSSTLAVLLACLFSAASFGQQSAPNGQDAAAIEQAKAAKIADAKQKIGKTLFDEVARLVPGELTAESPAGQGVQLAIKSFMENDGGKCKIILQQQCKENPQFPPADVLMAGLCFTAKDISNGTRFMEQAAIENPDHPAVYSAYGRLAVGTNRNVDATLHFDKLMALLEQKEWPAEVKSHYENEYLDGMTQAASRLKRYDFARQLIARRRQLKPDAQQPVLILSEIAFKEGKLDESLQLLKELRTMNSDTRAPEAVIGGWFARQGDMSKANEWMNRIPGKYTDDATALLEYASWSMSRENFESAASALESAESLKGATDVSNTLKGKLAFAKQRYGDAVSIFQQLADKSPANPDIANMLALSLIESGSVDNRTKANQIASKNLQSNPNNRIALATAGYIRLKTLGINPTIQAIFQKLAQTRDGRSPEVDYFLAAFFREAGNNQAAAQFLQQSLAFQGLFLYRGQAEDMRDKLMSSALPPK